MSRIPPMHERAWSLGQALSAFLAHPKFVTRPQYKDRVATCDTCPSRENQVCAECGCLIAVKALAKVWHCPLGKWDDPTGDA